MFLLQKYVVCLSIVHVMSDVAVPRVFAEMSACFSWIPPVMCVVFQYVKAVLWGNCTDVFRRGSGSKCTSGPLKDWGEYARASWWPSTSSGTWWALLFCWVLLHATFEMWMNKIIFRSFIQTVFISMLLGNGGCRRDIQRPSMGRSTLPWESPHHFTGMQLLLVDTLTEQNQHPSAVNQLLFSNNSVFS